MNYKFFLIFFLVFCFLGWPIAPAIAYEGEVVLTTEEHIKELQEQIARLKALIADIVLYKEISAQSYLVVDVDSNTVISQKNITQSHSIASITKLMNALVAVENTSGNESIILQEEMLKPQGYSPSLFLKLTVTVKNLLKASLIQSTNDAAQALTYVVGNDKFIRLMNGRARQLGMDDTYFYDAHGLDPSNRSTVVDITKLLTYLYNNHPDILEITKENDFQLPDPTGKLLTFKNLNAFSRVAEFIGGKTGYLPQARQSFAGLFDLNGKTVAIVLLYSNNRQTDTQKLIDWVKNNE
ncbi:MAG: hypothetical protein A3C50_00905 [Candidatus Staskawiczbacteria bacterium RIFCSPHIGHO2_02_FULL_43_16]|uniref:Peptidase S11 D-alanyl-D-alanine carboxypeptidase A N-terminal domain-containing protein n=1 Tax=Candidatus Staskawiczbacteria bacterium RIFCSPHIGHO2_01_FULL_41_41 TaxID=1802203 RepID=A0A1G2HU89_9BACT|nr:MAG: hypothetical protein A2822_00905 [Candidatus Staskawiczbacteria bacterium RIFCSPHIGHO2_01_FULL_41_41]OGZ68312.1 MAG: hypothetical protein A3C50_00905 [Candidatus Staskawiczbacteria bacterium RIFCSPHIGHO2_02_FULL_43_16]OGZ75103.1 MAG: hypothetical protein A3A12_00430 [Candidatus Staskawiczbacteria bacterium RIFCSPLOWO2_01_FULL_43_17b]